MGVFFDMIHRLPAATCLHWPMPITQELCWQLVSPCRRAHMKQQPELKLERAKAMLRDPDAQTGPEHIWLFTKPPPQTKLDGTQSSSVCPRTLSWACRKHFYKSPGVTAAAAVSPLCRRPSALWRWLTWVSSQWSDYVRTISVWVSQQVLLCVLNNSCTCELYSIYREWSLTL